MSRVPEGSPIGDGGPEARDGAFGRRDEACAFGGDEVLVFVLDDEEDAGVFDLGMIAEIVKRLQIR